MSSVSKGHDYEREVGELFERCGYRVTRSASSNGLFDLVAVKIDEDSKKVVFVAFMQCKYRTVKE